MKSIYVSPTAFTAFCRRLFGRKNWQGRVARYLEVGGPTVWRWANGKRPVSLMVELSLRYEELRRQVEAQPQPVLAHSIEILLRSWLDRNWSAIARGAMPELGPLERDLRALFKDVE